MLNINPHLIAASLLAFTVLALPASAEKPHVHGQGHLNMVIEAQELIMELTLPGADVVGFEHQAQTAAQKTAIKEAGQKLVGGDAFFMLPQAADCILKSAIVMVPEHDDDHGHGHGHDHGHSHEHDHDQHSEFSADYVFACQKIDALSEIKVKLFNAFLSLQELKLVMISPKGQRSMKLTPANPVLKF